MQIVVSGLLTKYEEFGSGSETILILPGWKRLAQEWVPVAKQLSNKYRVVILDLPGFGATQSFKDTVGIYEYARFVREFLLKIGIINYIVMGHSFGGRVAIILASDGKQVEKLVLVDSAGIEKRSLAAKLIRLLKKILDPVFILSPEPLKKIIRNIVGSADYKTTGEMRGIFKKIVNQDLTMFLPKIKTPVFIVWGENDKSLPVSLAKIFKKNIKNSTLRIVWGAGHDPHLGDEQQFMSVLSDIL